MEKHRILWVIFSISLLLVVVLAGGLYFLKPIQDNSLATAVKSGPVPFDTFEFVRGDSEPPGLDVEEQERQMEEMVIVVGEKEGGSAVPEAEIEPRLPIPLSTPSSSQAKRRPSRPAPQKVTEIATPAPKPVRVTEYWIQAGSYRSRSRAEALSHVLSDQGLQSKIMTRDIDGNTYYRVRIGPYNRQAEAKKFLSWVRATKGFESSYISQVYAQRTVN